MSGRRVRSGPRRAVLAAVTAALLFATPMQAAGAGGTYPVPAGSLVFGHLPGSNGYRVNFSESGGRHGERFKAVVKGHHGTVTYTVPAGRDPAAGIAANLGRRGRFDLRLRLGKVRRLRLGHGCEGEPGRWQRGYAYGSARFRGERHYTDARSRRIPIVFESWQAFRCHYTEGPRNGQARRAQVYANRPGLGFGALLSARPATPVDQRAIYRAWDYANAGRMAISREIKVLAPASTFAFPGGPQVPEDMTVDPPKPFDGSASFTRTPESTFTWTGDLTVEFPGLAPIRLTGTSFNAGVCAIEGCVRREREREPPP